MHLHLCLVSVGAVLATVTITTQAATVYGLCGLRSIAIKYDDDVNV